VLKARRAQQREGVLALLSILLQVATELALLPDNIISCIFSQLDALSRIRLAQTCKRFWVMHVDPSIWRMADLSTMQLRWMQEC